MRPTAASERGFTLLELLVVVFIIGLLAGLAVLSVDDRVADDRLQQEAQRLDALLHIAAEEAVLFGIELGLEVTRDGYRFLRLDADGWTPITAQDSPLRPRTLDENTTLHLIRADGENATDDEETDGPAPDVLFLSSGEITPFELSMTANEARSRYRYEGKLTGELELHRISEDRP